MNNFFKKLKEEFVRIYNSNKLFLVFLLISFLVGIIIAIINLISFKSIICLNNLIDVCLLGYFKKNISLFGFFVQKYFLCLFILILVFLVCSNKYSIYLLCALTLYFAYLIVFNMGVIILCFGFFGVIFAIFNILLTKLCFLLLCLFFGLYLKSNCGCNYFANAIKNYKFLLIICLILFVLVLLEMILLPLLSSTFIIIF